MEALMNAEPSGQSANNPAGVPPVQQAAPVSRTAFSTSDKVSVATRIARRKLTNHLSVG